MVIDNSTKECLLYILDHFDSFIEEEAYRVLSDSVLDPHHSAVTLSNLINSYLCVMASFGEEQVSKNITEYLLAKCFTLDEIKTIQQKREEESRYYIGKIVD